MRTTLLCLMYVLFFIGILGSLSLAYSEFTTSHICPELLSVPACYVIFSCFVVLLGLHLSKIKNLYFYIVISIPIGIALYGSVFQVLGLIECPKTEGAIPMCFISLAIFSSILLCKYLSDKK